MSGLTANTQWGAGSSKNAVEEAVQAQKSSVAAVAGRLAGVAARDDLAVAAGDAGSSTPHIEVLLLSWSGIGHGGEGRDAESDD